MKTLCYILCVFFTALFFEGCNKSNVYEQNAKTLDSLSGAINSMIKDLERVDTVTLQKSVTRFEWYKEFVEQNIHDTITKSEADNLQHFYKGGKNLGTFSFNRRMILVRASLINSQLQKLALDIKSKAWNDVQLSEYIKHEKNEAAGLIEAAYLQQKLFHEGLEEFKNSLNGVEILIKSRNNGELPTIIKDTIAL